MPAKSDAEKFRDKLAEMGEEQVAKTLVEPIWNEQRRAIARQWLEAQQRVRNEASQSTQTEIASSARDAAWESAKAARRANLIAIVALVIAVIAAVGAFWPDT